MTPSPFRGFRCRCLPPIFLRACNMRWGESHESNPQKESHKEAPTYAQKYTYSCTSHAKSKCLWGGRRIRIVHAIFCFSPSFFLDDALFNPSPSFWATHTVPQSAQKRRKKRRKDLPRRSKEGRKQKGEREHPPSLPLPFGEGRC